MSVARFPAFEIPRSVDRDSSFDHLKQGTMRRRLAAKNRHNFITILWCLFVRWFFVFMLTVLLGLVGDFYASLGAAAIVLNFVFAIVLGIAYEILVDRIVRGFKPLPVLFCSIYELAMWRHERYWKVPSTGYPRLRRHSVHQYDLAPRRCPDRSPGFQRRLRHD